MKCKLHVLQNIIVTTELRLNKNKHTLWYNLLKMMINFKFVWTPLHCKEVLLVDGLLSSTLCARSFMSCQLVMIKPIGNGICMRDQILTVNN